MDIVQSTSAYERWLKQQLQGDVVPGDIVTKHKEMCAGPFPFLRATYWRWAETIFDISPELSDAPSVLAVGDIHIENFGTWRGADGRLVWGVNDYDEAAEMPYVLDLVRLATSAVLANVRGISTGGICRPILNGYRAGLATPRAFVLDLQHEWLRSLFVVPEGDRAKFWKKFDPGRNQGKGRRKEPPRAYVEALEGARPDTRIQFTYWPRTAGMGSLGRPRWVGHALWHDAPVIREAKAIVPSGWTRAHGGALGRLRCHEIAGGAHRCPDPWLALKGSILIRRLSPNNRKLDLQEIKGVSMLVNPDMLWAMGRDLAAIHLGRGETRGAIVDDLERRKPRWLRRATKTAAEFIRREQKEWRKAFR